MLNALAQLQIGTTELLIIAFCGTLIGMSKGGIPGISMVVIPITAHIFGGKQSTGVLLPMLIMADCIAVWYYRRHANWGHLFRAMPWAIAGVLLALWIGENIDDLQFKRFIAFTIFISIGIMIWRDRKKNDESIPTQWWFAALMGLAGGFATMIGNAAGPIFTIYLLAMHLPKNTYIGTRAWFFFIINLAKFPLHVTIWKTINWSTLSLNIMVFPAILLGGWFGIYLVKRISGNAYRWMVIGVTLLAALLILV